MATKPPTRDPPKIGNTQKMTCQRRTCHDCSCFWHWKADQKTTANHRSSNRFMACLWLPPARKTPMETGTQWPTTGRLAMSPAWNVKTHVASNEDTVAEDLHPTKIEYLSEARWTKWNQVQETNILEHNLKTPPVQPMALLVFSS